ncbi:hypothetical protein H5410_046875 [Solanum commersonii]|uniref:Uncharacterized protein n=1 Tax=Solanum commersonii TaxID=4109 RepID=A0A9J5XDF7_SOLCO|nr:hypothetical protein H5410_046875 [Solanum commersonii]
MPRILLKERGAFGNADTGGAWLSSARAIRLPVISRRKVRMTSSHHAPYALGDTRATMAGTKVAIPRHTMVNSFPGLVHTAYHTMGACHARSRYLNHKEGDAEGRASDWSEVRAPSGRLARRAISSVVERAPDNCIVVPGL